MPSADIIVECPIKVSSRVRQVQAIFDLQAQKINRRSWSVRLPIEDRDWNIGLIVGPSGSGKTQILNNIFGRPECFEFGRNSSLLDAFPERVSIKKICELLSSVGFSSPPSYLRAFETLSNGEQFRVIMARALCCARSPVVMDEYSSIVDRTVAKIGSSAIAKIIRKHKMRFVAASCHYDILDWLQPDWIYQPDTQDFQWRELQRFPAIELEIAECNAQAWRIFGRHHYLSGNIHRSARCFTAFWQQRPVCFSSWLFMPRRNGRRMIREHRTVTLPDFQGVGIGNAVSEHIAQMFVSRGEQVFSVTSHPAMIAHRNRSSLWAMIRKPSMVPKRGARAKLRYVNSRGRITASFRYIGETARRCQPCK